jgi:hypothetical protein
MATQEQSKGQVISAQGPEYLDCLQALARELDCAMQSISVNALSSLEESVSRQLVLCSRLSSLSEVHQSRRSDVSLAASSSKGDDLGARIEDAKAKLLTLNRSYGALLNHTRRTVQMFAGLARGYSGYPHAGAQVPNRSWSAEI